MSNCQLMMVSTISSSWSFADTFYVSRLLYWENMMKNHSVFQTLSKTFPWQGSVQRRCSVYLWMRPFLFIHYVGHRLTFLIVDSDFESVDTDFIRWIHRTSSFDIVKLSTVPNIGYFGMFKPVIVGFANASIRVRESSSRLLENPCDPLFLCVVLASPGLA